MNSQEQRSSLVANGFFVPKNYHIAEDRLIENATGEYYLIRNRSFAEIDHIYRNLPSRIIEESIRTNPTQIVRILDVGGGQKSKAAKQIAERYGDKVTVINADLIANPPDKSVNIFPIPSSIFELPFQDKTFDIVYTRMLLHHFSDIPFDQDGSHSEVRRALAEMTRVLKDGGIAIADDEHFSNMEPDDPKMKTLTEELSVNAIQYDSGLFLKGTRRLDRIINPDYYFPSKLLVFTKGTIDPRICKILDKTPRRLSKWKNK